ncbi:unnamed protein product [Bursaphelenchus okinawaensis]|uniref:C2HC/C3H-type domain-containing protein n=1 Tax=Bursaphelenchus okinawaensis TaxID=465554 RepID=A0A811LNC3_9BILA|nr:unnamed protein product [Bursaphelenchus okinawaensis]CAG9124719.1 unnamed protein product [Bursaphelenchus okinawaensis]
MTSSKLPPNPHDNLAAVAGQNGTFKDDRDPKEKTYPCKVCGRHFIKSSLVKHEPACKKLTKVQRKVFDSGKQRAQGSDITLQAVRKAQKEKEKAGGVFQRPKTHWRERHEEFIGAVSASRKVEHALKTGAPLPPPPKTSVNPNYIRCDYCGRSFNPTAAERHIPFCREKNGRQKTTMSRSQSVGRTHTSKSTESRSQSRRQSRDHSPITSHSAALQSRQRVRTGSGKSPAPVNGRVPTGMPKSRAGQQTNSASHTRTSALPTPVKSRSAPRTTSAASRASTVKGKSNPTTPQTPKPSTGKPKTPKTPKPKTPAKVAPIVPKTPTVPKTSKTLSKAAKQPKTPKIRSKSRSPMLELRELNGFALAAPYSKDSERSKSRNGIKKSGSSKNIMEIERISTRNGSKKVKS